MQAVRIKTNQKLKVNFCLPKLGATEIVTWGCHVDDSSEIRYSMIIGSYFLIALVLLLLIKQSIEGGGGPFEICT